MNHFSRQRMPLLPEQIKKGFKLYYGLDKTNHLRWYFPILPLEIADIVGRSIFAIKARRNQNKSP
jgi:hypothetical protein